VSGVRIPEEEVPVERTVDVLVAGGGSAGCAAAITAARRGLRTVLIEDMPFLGGMSTGGAVGTYCGFYAQEHDGGLAPIVGGLPLELASTLLERRHAYGPMPFRDSAALPYVPWGVKRLLDERVSAETNLELWLHARLTHAVTDGGRIRGVVVQTRSGRVAFQAGVFVDATGDAELVRACGLPVDRYAERQYPSMMFTMQNVDAGRALGDPAGLRRILEEGHEKEGLPRRGGNLIPTGRPGEVLVALSRVSIEGRPIDGSDARELTRGEVEGRAQAEQLADFLKARVAGFEAAYLADAAARLGIRETVHIRGHARLTRDDVLGLRKFPDGIGRSAWPIELHVEGGETVWEFLPRGEHYTIPYAALVPQEIGNLLAVGRCISATREGFASVRVIGPCMLEGQAAGVAAGEALARDVPLGDVDVDRIRAALAELGVPL
jgi:glycine/D-amino acid oxidase-like deaminating enzyme